jgi:hypothetical protein
LTISNNPLKRCRQLSSQAFVKFSIYDNRYQTIDKHLCVGAPSHLNQINKVDRPKGQHWLLMMTPSMEEEVT